MNSEKMRDDSQSEQVPWLVAGRFALLGLALAAASYSWMVTETLQMNVFYPLAALFAINLALVLWFKSSPKSEWFYPAQVALDILIVTGAVYVTGATQSPLLYLYVPVIMAAGVTLSRRSALIASAGCIAIYAAMIGALEADLLVWPSADSASMAWSAVVLQLVGLSSSLILAAIFTAYLSTLLAQQRAHLAASHRSYDELGQRQQELFNQLPYGVVTLDSTFNVAKANRVAIELLGSELQTHVGKSFQSFIREAGEPLFYFHPELSTEIEVNSNSAGKAVKLALQTMPSADARAPILVLVSDVTSLRDAELKLKLQEQFAELLAQAGNEQENSSSLELLAGNTPIMNKVFNLIRRVAPSEVTVLIQGESGTGKELVARSIHNLSSRPKGPFIAVNCGAIPETLVESELFGHKRGAFTGALADAPGLIRQAQGGTLFLDEVGELPLASQAKLLRVLQERMVRPVGSESQIPVDIRLIAATNRNLKEAVARGEFREDLFYRLNVINITLPPLRERREDLSVLIPNLIKKIVGEGKQVTVAPSAMTALLSYNYPGNVRELENILERAYVLGGTAILPEHLPEHVLNTDERSRSLSPAQQTQIITVDQLEFPVALDDILAAIEKKYILAALSQTGGMKKKAAKLLGINFRSFRYRVKKFDLGDDLDAEESVELHG